MSRQEIAGWFIKEAEILEMIADEFLRGGALKVRAGKLREYAAQVENMRCKTCDRYVPGEDDEACTFNQIEYQGPGFGCFVHKPKEVNK